MKTGEIAVNINGDLSDEELIERALMAERAVKRVWIGELEFFRDPLEVAELISENTSLEVCILLSPSRRSCSEIIKLAKKYPIGLIPGKSKNLSDFISCLKSVRRTAEEVYVGCSGKKLAKAVGKLSDGILANYVYPEYIKWLGEFEFVAAFGPSLVLPSTCYEDLLIAAAIVMGSNRNFLEQFNLSEVWNELSSVDFTCLIRARQRGESVRDIQDFKLIKKHRKLLLEKFTISGGIKDVCSRIRKLLDVCNCIVLGDPFFRDAKSMEKLPEIVNKIKN